MIERLIFPQAKYEIYKCWKKYEGAEKYAYKITYSGPKKYQEWIQSHTLKWPSYLELT